MAHVRQCVYVGLVSVTGSSWVNGMSVYVVVANISIHHGSYTLSMHALAS